MAKNKVNIFLDLYEAILNKYGPHGLPEGTLLHNMIDLLFLDPSLQPTSTLLDHLNINILLLFPRLLLLPFSSPHIGAQICPDILEEPLFHLWLILFLIIGAVIDFLSLDKESR
jgi:hypothetical protein